MIKDLRDSEAKLLALLEDPIYDEETAEASKLDVQIVEVIACALDDACVAMFVTNFHVWFSF